MFERIAPERHDTLDGVREPAENPTLVGHASVASGLAAAYREGRLPHAMIFAGPRGIGKATLAFHLAGHLLRHPNPSEAPIQLSRPEPESPLFRQVAAGAHPAVLHLTRPLNDKGDKFKTVLPVDEIRRVSRFLTLTAHDGAYRVVIVDPADDMNTEAANALLKSLEEPPARTVFLLIAHSLGSLLPTIRSRCQILRLTPLAPAELNEALAACGVGLSLTPPAQALLAERAGGSVREALLLTQFGGLEIAEAIDAVAQAAKPDLPAMHALADAVSARATTLPFDIFNRHVLEVVSRAAGAAAAEGDLERAAGLSRFWEEALETVGAAETYNLDKRQHALELLFRLGEALRRNAPLPAAVG